MHFRSFLFLFWYGSGIFFPTPSHLQEWLNNNSENACYASKASTSILHVFYIFLLTIISITHCQIESNIVRCPNPEYAEKMIAAIDAVRVRGDSIGGVVTCIVKNCPRVRTLSLRNAF